ncbi:hypothetical protein BLA29_013417, partial [Euroglyphus maynei]
MFCCQNSDEKKFLTKKNIRQVGPIEKERRQSNHCTDIPFAIVFILFLFGLGAIAFYAFNIGSPFRLIHGSDSFGNVCGQRN